MSMRWDYVSELRPPTGMLFVPQVMYEYIKPRWNNIVRLKLLIRPSSLEILPAKQEDHCERNFALRNISFILVGIFNAQ
jgi:hypothetical protein